MSLLVAGSVALDTVKAPSGRVGEAARCSATFFSAEAPSSARSGWRRLSATTTRSLTCGQESGRLCWRPLRDPGWLTLSAVIKGCSDQSHSCGSFQG